MFPIPIPGQVIRYAYLWQSQHMRGQEEGEKDRPCAIVLTTANEQGQDVVTVLPITHTPPSHSSMALAIEIPHPTKRRLGLDNGRSWVVLTEANRFIWPGPDLRLAPLGDAASVLYGELPAHLFVKIRDAFVAAFRSQAASVVQRTE